jgi:hypothetical protein
MLRRTRGHGGRAARRGRAAELRGRSTNHSPHEGQLVRREAATSGCCLFVLAKWWAYVLVIRIAAIAHTLAHAHTRTKSLEEPRVATWCCCRAAATATATAAPTANTVTATVALLSVAVKVQPGRRGAPAAAARRFVQYPPAQPARRHGAVQGAGVGQRRGCADSGRGRGGIRRGGPARGAAPESPETARAVRGAAAAAAAAPAAAPAPAPAPAAGRG